jgi:DNA repair exonuclease SbcCD nuclease subunit
MKEIKLAVVSDIHLGSRRNETEYIIQNLDREFADDSSFSQLDLLVLAGDVFDRLLNLSDECVYSIDAWIIRLLRLCKKHDVILRVLYGTPSHDREQSQRFVLLNDEARINADLQYVKELSIEYIEKLDINVLYVPDEWEEDPFETLSQVKELMTIRNLKTVDFAFMHGQFTFQLPPIVRAPRHDECEYLKLVDKLIFIGHIHTHNRYDRIIAQGSFDRLSHNEEEAKGHVRAIVRSRDDFELVFHENKQARKYITIDCEHLSLEQTLYKVHQATECLPDGSHVRLSCSKDNAILTEMEQLVRYRPFIVWTKIVRSIDGDIQHIDDSQINDEYVPIQITKENINKLVMVRASSKTFDPKLLDLAEKLLTELR